MIDSLSSEKSSAVYAAAASSVSLFRAPRVNLSRQVPVLFFAHGVAIWVMALLPLFLDVRVRVRSALAAERMCLRQCPQAVFRLREWRLPTGRNPSLTKVLRHGFARPRELCSGSHQRRCPHHPLSK